MTYYAFINNGKIDGCGQCKQLTQDVLNVEISDDIASHIQDFVWDGEKIVEDENHTYQKDQVRAVREQYFDEYVDFYQSKPLYWEEIDETLKQDIADYRNYLKDYTKEENWWEKNPLTFDEWKEQKDELGATS